MENALKAIADMESACDSEAALLSVRLPDIKELIAALKLLPLEHQHEMRDRLQRIQVIMEGQMLLYAAETEHLRDAIRTATLPKPRAASADGTVATIRITHSFPDSATTTLQ
ncbi:MAG: hypothetical protein B7X02_00450 [Rhodospirillales bacterium 12-54-5]|nr:MAG: hypothetical protein B7X02_00450 [Rhodospirillales bacterium 12-54-5]